MNITSMSGSELFRTIMGKEPKKPTLDVIREASADGVSDGSKGFTKLDDSVSSGNRDVFVKSSKEINPETDSFSRFLEYDNELGFKISAGMTKEQLATHFGDMAKRLDEAYAQGKFTEEEYNELNEGIMSSFDDAITRCERKAASDEVIKENMRARHAALAAGATGTARSRSKTNIEKILEGMGVYGKDSNELTEEEARQLRDLLDAMEKAEKERKEKEEEEKSSAKIANANKDNSEDGEFLARLKEVTERLDRQITDFASKYCRTDRAAMRNMLDTVRKGGELVGGRDKTYGGGRPETWYTDGYVPKPYL